MTIFMGPRTNYILSRYQWHSKASWLALLITILIGWSAVEERKVLIPVAVVSGGALVTKNGRKIIRRGVSEVFYGCLFSFTGVFHGDRGRRGAK